jgi:hypothetical protein
MIPIENFLKYPIFFGGLHALVNVTFSTYLKKTCPRTPGNELADGPSLDSGGAA